MKLTLHTSLKQFHELHELAATKRKTPLRVDREALMNLLMDHSAMIDRLGDQVEPQEK